MNPFIRIGGFGYDHFEVASSPEDLRNAMSIVLMMSDRIADKYDQALQRRALHDPAEIGCHQFSKDSD